MASDFPSPLVNYSGLGLLIAFGGSFLARRLAGYLPGIGHDPAVVFVVGGCLSLWSVTAGTLLLAARTFDRFDPSRDVPA